MVFASAVFALLIGTGCCDTVTVDDSPAEQLAALKSESKTALRDFNRGNLPGSSDAVKKKAADLYRERIADFVKRATALADAHPDSAEAPEALALLFSDVLGGYAGNQVAACDTILDAVTARYLNNEAILPVIWTVWADAPWAPQAEPFLRTALDKSTNPKVKGVACFYLAKHQERLSIARRSIDDPVRGETIRKTYGPDNVRRLRALDADELKREATALLEQTTKTKEFAAIQLWGRRSVPLGELARSSLFRIKNLEIGCAIPEIAGEDIDGKPMTLSEFRGKVVLVSFWATWCGPCMAMVPAEKDLVERMKSRPFVLVGVNGDDDRQKAKSGAAKHSINWRSFWEVGGPRGATPTKWGVQSWPTSYLVDAKGVIREANLRGLELDKAVEALVKETEAMAEKP